MQCNDKKLLALFGKVWNVPQCSFDISCYEQRLRGTAVVQSITCWPYGSRPFQEQDLQRHLSATCLDQWRGLHVDNVGKHMAGLVLHVILCH